MPNSTDFPALHYLPYDYSTSGLLQGTHHIGENHLSDLEADTPSGTAGSLFDTHHPGQDPHQPNALWEITTTQTPEVTNPLSQEVLGVMDVFDAVSATYPTYSVGPHTPAYPPVLRVTSEGTYLDLRHTAGESVPYSPEQSANPEAGGSSYGAFGEMEPARQSVPEMIFTGRSPSRPFSAFSDRDGPPAWSRPDHICSTSGHSESDFLGLLPHPPEVAPPRRSVRNTSHSTHLRFRQ